MMIGTSAVSQLHERSASRHIRSLVGMNDLDSLAWQRSDHVLSSLRNHMGSRGYQPIDTPLLEGDGVVREKVGRRPRRTAVQFHRSRRDIGKPAP